MEQIPVECTWIEGISHVQPSKDVQISIVAYEHPLGIPARFYIGLVPAVALSKHLELIGINSTVRIIDPTSIANYCNDWEQKKTEFQEVISRFMSEHKVSFFFDESEPLTNGALEVLKSIGNELLTTRDLSITDIVQRIRESGRKHGGDSGADNAILYMAAHPFSWLDMHHPLIWKRRYSSSNCQFINLMSKPESRFSLVRKFLRSCRQDLSTMISPVDIYMTVCNTPCYIPLEREPIFTDLINKGYEWCHTQYQELKGQSGNHRRALKDFELLKPFIKEGGL